MAITSAFQADDAGSIPVARSDKALVFKLFNVRPYCSSKESGPCLAGVLTEAGRSLKERYQHLLI